MESYSNQGCVMNNSDLRVKTCTQNSLFYKGIRLFNTIPTEIKEADCFRKFENLLKTYTQ